MQASPTMAVTARRNLVPGHTGIFSETVDSPLGIDLEGEAIDPNRFIDGVDGAIN